MRIKSLSYLSLALLFAVTVKIHAKTVLVAPFIDDGIEAYTNSETERIFLEHLKVDIKTAKKVDKEQFRGSNLVVVGTVENNRFIKHLVESKFVSLIDKQQGYSIRCGPNPHDESRWILAIAGSDVNGALYGLRDLEHYYLKNFKLKDGILLSNYFSAIDFPRIEYRGHWVWGCNMPDKKAWMENMSRWKLNELIHWDNFPPEKAREYVDFAHTRGIRVVWGFGWGWNPDWNFNIPKGFDHGIGKGVQMCGSSEFNKKFFQREILNKVRNIYVPTGCDGIYFQAFTEVPKCQCKDCKAKSKGRIMLEFVNPIVDSIKKEFPDLWISCGVHANLGYYAEMKDLDPRCNIYWENCDSGTSIRGEYEDFGYINKTLPYSHGFSKTCPADPPYTEESLVSWMKSNQHRYWLAGDIDTYYDYMRKMQKWSGQLLGKKSINKHATTVACHSVFCRRTPFMHIALAESQWNPDLDTEKKVDAIVDFLGIRPGIPTSSALKVQHDAVGKSVKLNTSYSQKYTAGGDKALVDGKISEMPVVNDKRWQGYEGEDLDLVIDLGKIISVNSLSSGYLQCVDPGVFLPVQVEYLISTDGIKYQSVGVVKGQISTNQSKNQRQTFSIQGLDLEGRYIRVKAANVGRIPEWHRAPGRKAWLFVDEVMVNPVIIN